MKGGRGSDVIAPLILATIYSKRSASCLDVLFTGKAPPLATEQEVGWACEEAWRFWSTHESNVAYRKVG